MEQNLSLVDEGPRPWPAARDLTLRFRHRQRTLRPPPTATRRSRTAGVARSSEAVQFVVSYLAEQTFQATSALEALQQAQARGATEVTSIVRIA